MAGGDALLVAVRRFCRREGLLRPGPLVVAVSGGADSVCLLRLLMALAPEQGLALHIAHFQHGLRGDEAEADARFVAALADQLGLPASFGIGDVAAAARRCKRSLEAVAHDLRWAFLEGVRARQGAEAVASGHSMDDQAETLLLHLLRGSGPRGLAGLAPRQGAVVRPLLASRHAEAVAWCRAQGQPWREDASNAEPWCARNRVRLELLPALRRFNPALVTALAGTAEALQLDLAYLEGRAAAALAALRRRDADGLERLDLAGYGELPAALRRHLLLGWLGEGTVRRHLLAAEALLAEGRAGDSVDLPGGQRLIRDYAEAVLAPRGEAAPLPEVALAVPGTTEAASWGWRLTAESLPGPALDGGDGRGVPLRRPARQELLPDPSPLARDRWVALLDAERVALPLTLRPRRPGDRILLPGVAGAKKLQDLLVDAKMPRRERGRLGVVAAANGIVWLAGLRLAGWAAATERSRSVLRLTVQRESGAGRGAP